MKLIVFAMVFLLLVASSSLAQGLAITRVDARVDYDNAYIYRLEQEEKLTRVNNAVIPLINDSRINVDVFPGSNLTLTVTLENTFTDDTQDLRNIFTKITIEGTRHGSDVKEEDGNFDLEPGSEGKADVKFKIPFDIDTGTHNVIIEAGGANRNDTSFKTGLRLKLDIKKLGHDLRITKVSLNPSVVSCYRKTTLTAEIANAGSNAEDQVALEFKVPGTGFSSFDKDVYLAASNEADDNELMHTKTSSIEVPSFFKAGKYPILVNLYWKNLVIFDQKTMELVVKDCGSAVQTEPQEEKNETAIVIQPSEGTREIPPEGLITATEEVSIFDSPVLLSMLLGGGFIITILAVMVIFGLIRKSRV